jgi:hypothetical protein
MFASPVANTGSFEEAAGLRGKEQGGRTWTTGRIGGKNGEDRHCKIEWRRRR